MNQDEFAYAVGRVRALENRMIEGNRFNRLIDAVDLDEMMKILAETEYARSSSRPDPYRYEEIIDAEVRRTYDTVASFSPDPMFTGVFYAQYDFHNLKAHLKAAMLPGCDPGNALVDMGFVGPKGIGRIVAEAVGTGPSEQSLKAGIDRELPGGEGFDPTVPVDEYDGMVLLEKSLRNTAKAALLRYMAAKRDPQQIDLLADRASFDFFTMIAESRGAEFLLVTIAAMADIANIKAMLRARTMGKTGGFLSDVLLDHGTIRKDKLVSALNEPAERIASLLSATAYGRAFDEGLQTWARTGSLRKLEASAQQYLKGLVASTRLMSMGYEPVVGYLMSKEQEAGTLRRIFVGKVNRLPSDAIRERLCDAYA